MRTSTKRIATIATAAVIAVGGATAARAWWSIEGDGSATAKAGDAQKVTVEGTATGLFPGGFVDVSLTGKNPNPFAVDIFGGAVTKVESDSSACDPANFTVNENMTFKGVHLDAGPGSTTTTKLAKAVGLKGTAPDACKNVTFKITATLKGTQTQTQS
jgi:hypothetical protein